jgi:hypothetical protein
MLCITGIQLSTDILLMVYSIYKARKQRDKCCFEMYKLFRQTCIILRKSLRFYAIYKLMLCITGIQLDVDIILTVYSLYRARKELDCLDSVVKCINISDVNIESKIFEILQPRTQALCVVLWLAWPLRGPRGSI